MTDAKTKPTGASVTKFLAGVSDAARRQDCLTLLQLMKRVTGAEPRMWASGMVGFGSYHYKYATGREGDWFRTGFAPRKQDLTVYVMAGLDKHPTLLARLGKYKAGKSCLYVKRLGDVNLDVLEELIVKSLDDLNEVIASRKGSEH
jgi:hypothetical protein